MGLFSSNRFSPIGLDVGTESIKMAQLELRSERPRIVALAQRRLAVAGDGASAERLEALYQGVQELLRSGGFRGRRVVLALNSRQLFIQNLRLPCVSDSELAEMVQWEAQERLPDDFGEAEVRHLVAGQIRTGSLARDPAASRQEVILLACRRRDIDELIALSERLRLRPQGLDMPACALLRSLNTTMRRKSDEQQGLLLVDLGAGASNVVVTRGREILMLKSLPVSGHGMDQQVAERLELSSADAAALRRQWAETDGEGMNQEVVRALREAVRAQLETLALELIRCVRYHGVTFRGCRITKALLFGGEARPELAQLITDRIGIPCELGDPFTGLHVSDAAAAQIDQQRRGIWAVAVGLCTKPKRPAA